MTNETKPQGSNRPKATVRMELPPATVELLDKHGLKIEIRGKDRKLFMDQGSGMAEGDGCIGTEGGPSC
jgi:hypothetical protein